MNLNIGGKDYTLEFGLGFIAEIDKTYTQEMNGIEFGLGIEMVNMYLSNENPLAVFNVIKCATSHLKQKPSNADIEAFLSEQGQSGKLSKFTEDLIKHMRDEPFLKAKFKKMDKDMRKV